METFTNQMIGGTMSGSSRLHVGDLERNDEPQKTNPEPAKAHDWTHDSDPRSKTNVQNTMFQIVFIES